MKSGGLSKPNLHIEALEGGSMRRACESTREGWSTSGIRVRVRKVLKIPWETVRRLRGMVRSITGHHRCSLVGTKTWGHHQGTRLLGHSPCFCSSNTTWDLVDGL